MRGQVRSFIEAVLEEELKAALDRDRYARLTAPAVPCAAVAGLGSEEPADGGACEWQNTTLSAYRRRTKEVDALIAGDYLASTNTRHVSRALAGLFQNTVSKSTVSRVWRKIKADCEVWTARDLGDEDVVRLILNGTVVKVRLYRKATSITLLVVLEHWRGERGGMACDP